MNIPWEMLFELISELVEKCLVQGTPETKVRSSLVDPTWRDWAQVRRALRTAQVEDDETGEKRKLKLVERWAYYHAMRSGEQRVSAEEAVAMVAAAKARIAQ